MPISEIKWGRRIRQWDDTSTCRSTWSTTLLRRGRRPCLTCRELLARPLQLYLLYVETRRFDVVDVRTRCVDSSTLDDSRRRHSSLRRVDVGGRWLTSSARPLNTSIRRASSTGVRVGGKLVRAQSIGRTCRARPRPHSNRSRGRRVAPPNVQTDDSRLCDRTETDSVPRCARRLQNRRARRESMVDSTRRLQNRRARRESMVDSTRLRVAHALDTVEPIARARIAVVQCLSPAGVAHRPNSIPPPVMVSPL